MKPHHYIIAALCIPATSCNRHPDSPPLFEQLDIVTEYEPQSTLLKWGEMTPDERHEYPSGGFMINSRDEFPDDPRYNLSDLKAADIDFDNYTLLVAFDILPGYVLGHRLYWQFDHTENQLQFLTWTELTEGSDDDEFEEFTYYRSAITVSKIAPDAKVAYIWSYSSK